MNILIEFKNNPIFFTSPISIIKCFTLQEVPRCLAAVEQWLKKGFFVCGFISYEAGYAFEQRLAEGKKYAFPLICLGCYKQPITGGNKVLETSGQSKISDIRITPSREKYNKDIAAIRDYISRGEVYQVTYCVKLHFTFHGSAFHLYRKLLRAQPVPYAAYLETGDLKILSMSPEMFLKKTGGSLVTKPMKGTWPRGNHFISDIFSGLRLKYDETPVDQFPPNAFGLYDMHGNLWEWCADAWHDSYDGAPIDDRVWQSAGNETYRVARGGCWHDIPGVCRSAARLKADANDAEEIIGVRVVQVA